MQLLAGLALLFSITAAVSAEWEMLGTQKSCSIKIKYGKPVWLK
jgi:hypothetical protein